MAVELFLELASQVTKLEMYPYFDIAQSVLCVLHVRDDLGPGLMMTQDVRWGRAITLIIPSIKYIRLANDLPDK